MMMPAASVVMTSARRSRPRAISRANRYREQGSGDDEDEWREPQELHPQRGKHDGDGGLPRRDCARSPQHQDRTDGQVQEERAVVRQICGPELGDVEELRDVSVFRKIPHQPPAVWIGHRRDETGDSDAESTTCFPTVVERKRADAFGRCEEDDEQHSEEGLDVQVAPEPTRGTAQIGGVAEPRRRARSMSSAHAAIPAKDARCGRGIARGSRTNHPSTRTAITAAVVARSRAARNVSTKVSESGTAWAIWIPVPFAACHAAYAPRWNSQGV